MSVVPTLAEILTEPREFPDAAPAPVDTAAPTTDTPAPDASAVAVAPAEAVPATAPDATTPAAVAPATSTETPAPSAVPVAPDAAPITARPPLVVNAAGQAFPIEGSYTDDTGSGVIPKAVLPRAMELISRGIHHEKVYPDLQRREAEAKRAIAESETKQTEREVEAGHVFTWLAEKLTNDPDLRTYLGSELEVVLANAKVASRDHRLKMMEERGKPTPEQQAETERSHVTAGMTDILTAASAHPEFRDMFRDPAWSQRVANRLLRRAPTLIRFTNGQLDPDAIKATNVELLDMLEDWKDRRVAHTPDTAPAQNGTAAAMAKAAAAPAPGKAPSVTASAGPVRDTNGRFANLHPDAPEEVRTSHEARMAWFAKRERAGLPIYRTD